MSEATVDITERARELHADAIVVDGLQIDDWGPGIFDEMRKGGLTAVNCTCCVWEDFQATIDNIVAFKAWIRESDYLRQIYTVADIRRAGEENAVGIILGFQNTSALESNLAYLQIFHELGVRVMQVTYNTQNLFGAGAYETNDAGLTDFGHEALAEMNRLGLLADLSHVGPQTSRDVITHSAKPVVYTHVAPAALKEHPRTKSDEELRFIADHDGLAGACLLPAFMAAGNNATVEDYVDLIDHMVNVMGEDQVANWHRLHAGAQQDILRVAPARQGLRALGHAGFDQGADGASVAARHSGDRRVRERDRDDATPRLAGGANSESARRKLAANLRRGMGREREWIINNEPRRHAASWTRSARATGTGSPPRWRPSSATSSSAPAEHWKGPLRSSRRWRAGKRHSQTSAAP